MMATSGKQLVRSKSGLRMVSVEEKDTSPFQLQEPPWIPDEQVENLDCHMIPKAVTILYKYIDEMREVTMAVPDDSSRKQSIAWIVALQKVQFFSVNYHLE
nr:uncharacterized protein LOC129265351 [Lytechinus pictus]